MSYNKEQVLSALKTVIHPDKKRDIVALGLVSNVVIEGKKVSFTLVFDKPNDPFVNSIRKACVHAIQENLGEDVDIKGNISVKVQQPAPPKEDNLLPGVKNVIAIASGKGGVGKSTVAVNTAIAMAKKGAKVGLVDADIYGPSIPLMFGLENEKPSGQEINGKTKVIPFEKYGIKLLSIGFFVDPSQALIWRGPMASNALKQLFTEAEWGDLDYMIIDLPPGTGDIHLTLVQSLQVSGVAIVSTPQNVALADARKAVNMFSQKDINVPVLGLIENMSWFTPAELPNNKYFIFGEKGGEKLIKEMGIPLLGQIPIVQSIRESGDMGKPIVLSDNDQVSESFKECAGNIINQVEKRNKNLDPTKKVEIDPNHPGCEH